MGIREFKKRLRFLAQGEDSLPGYKADGFRVMNKNTDFMNEPKFAAAWKFSEWGNKEAWSKRKRVPDVRWRAHTCCWAAQRALKLDGDFVELGVNAGLLSMTVCEYLGFGSIDRKFWLFDTFAGIPETGLPEAETEGAIQKNKGIYQDVFALATRNFAKFPNAKLVRGALPGTLDGVPIEKIAYLSIDLNSAHYERQCIDIVWDRVVPGAAIVLDDYAFQGQNAQNAMWNEFAAAHGQSILTLPTGQGLMIKQ